MTVKSPANRSRVFVGAVLMFVAGSFLSQSGILTAWAQVPPPEESHRGDAKDQTTGDAPREAPVSEGNSAKDETDREDSTEVKQQEKSKNSGEKRPKESNQSKSEPAAASTSKKTGAAGVPLIVGGEELFRIRVKLGPYTPDVRVDTINARLKKLEASDKFKVQQITTSESSFSTDIVAGDLTIFTITDLDAQAEGSRTRQELANEYATHLRTALEREIESGSLPNLLLRIAMSVVASLVLLMVLGLSNWLFPRLYRVFASLKGTHIRSLKIQQAVLLPEDTVIDIGIGFLRLIRLSAVLSILGIYLTLVLSFFPQTRGVSNSILQLMMAPVVTVLWPAIVSYAPNLLFIATIVVCSYYAISFTRYIFSEIGRGTISFPSFDADWAGPTYKIVRFLMVAFAAVLIFPYLPGAGSPAFQQVSLFLGILVSLGSSGAIAHVIAGVFLTYTGAFKVGDRVKIADTIGDVVEKTLLATRIRTIKQEVITIPNGLVLGSHIVNYSSSAASAGLILHSTVTIGYDAPWRQVHQLLIDAALATEGIVPEPVPFVFQTSLDDFYVSYQINAYTDKPHIMAATYSQLHQNIQDSFNKAGVEIMSPHYSTLRDGNQTTIPSSYLKPGYEPPRFGMHLHPLHDSGTINAGSNRRATTDGFTE